MSSIKQIKKKIAKALVIDSSRPGEVLQRYAKKNPDFWLSVEKSKRTYLSQKLEWPGWCHVPMSPRYPEFSKKYARARFNDAVMDLAVVHCFAAWRQSLGIYRFDEHLAQFVSETPIKDVPVSIFHRLPQHCLYIEAPVDLCKGLDAETLHGAFVFLDFDVEAGSTLLWIIFDPVGGLPYSVPFNLKSGFLAREYVLSMEERITEKRGDLASRSVSGILNLLFYVLTDNADFKDGAWPKMAAAGQGARDQMLAIPRPSTVWNLGQSVGAKFENHGVMKRKPYWMMKTGCSEELPCWKWIAPAFEGSRQ